MDLNRILSTPSPSHVFESGLLATFPPPQPSIQTDIERLIQDKLELARREVDRKAVKSLPDSEASISDDLSHALATSVFTTLGTYLMNTITVFQHFTQALIADDVVASETRKELERSKRTSHYGNLTTIHAMDITVEKLKKVVQKTVDYKDEVENIWAGKDQELDLSEDVIPDSPVGDRKRRRVYVPNEQRNIRSLDYLLSSYGAGAHRGKEAKPALPAKEDQDAKPVRRKRSFEEANLYHDARPPQDLRPRQDYKPGHGGSSSQDMTPAPVVRPIARTTHTKRPSRHGRHNLLSRAQADQGDSDSDEGSEATDDERFGKIDMEALKHRGKGEYTCPKGMACGKGGVARDGKSVVIFDRNSAFAQHINKHIKPYRCGLEGCPNTEMKRRFARRDGLERHQRTVVHPVEDITAARAKISGVAPPKLQDPEEGEEDEEDEPMEENKKHYPDRD